MISPEALEKDIGLQMIFCTKEGLIELNTFAEIKLATAPVSTKPFR